MSDKSNISVRAGKAFDKFLYRFLALMLCIAVAIQFKSWLIGAAIIAALGTIGYFAVRTWIRRSSANRQNAQANNP